MFLLLSKTVQNKRISLVVYRSILSVVFLHEVIIISFSQFDTSMANSAWNDKDMAADMCENNAGDDFSSFFLGEENSTQPPKKHSDRSLVKEVPNQFIRDDLFFGDTNRRGSDFL